MLVSPDETDVTVLHAALVLAEEQRAKLMVACARLLKLEKGIEYRTTEEQSSLHVARTVLAECNETDAAAHKANADRVAKKLAWSVGGDPP